MSILIRNAYRIYTFDDSNREFEKGYVYVDGKVISAVGSGDTGHLKADEVVDASGKLVLPGLINVHHHFYQNLTRNVPAVQKCDLLTWLRYLYAVWTGIDEEAIYYGALVAMGELLLTGCTTTTDFLYLFPKGQRNLIDYEFKAAAELGIRFHGFRGCMPTMEGNLAQELAQDQSVDPSQLIESEDQILAACEEAFNRHHDPKAFAMNRVGVGPTAVTYDRTSLMKDLKKLSSDRDGLCQTHLHPRLDEIEICERLHHCTPLEFLEGMGWLDGQTSIAHATRHTARDIEILTRNGARVTHSPSCHMRLGYPVAPVPEMLSRGIVVGIGVDGGASNDSGDMLGELRTAMMVHRINGVHKDLEIKDWLRPQDVFHMATKNGARILNRNDIGSLEVGKGADIILIDISGIPYAGGLHDPLGALVYCGCNHIIDTSIINGQFVVRNGRLARTSQESIASKANEISSRLLSKASRKASQ
ncbi:MAG: hypothetical protein A2156_15795 [Deltaproteobacteria bacterium RBG_16_48_10]|nr:MAG: hypothetical protein A2156_15795 [Deltaproteobacteria bacterium RBG_16_48_10]